MSETFVGPTSKGLMQLYHSSLSMPAALNFRLPFPLCALRPIRMRQLSMSTRNLRSACFSK